MFSNIPRIMRSKGWNNGARLLEIWFSHPSVIPPAYGLPDTNTIDLDRWALIFSRARQVYDRLIREQIWANPPAQTEIASMLRRKGLLTGGGQSFGNRVRLWTPTSRCATMTAAATGTMSTRDLPT